MLRGPRLTLYDAFRARTGFNLSLSLRGWTRHVRGKSIGGAVGTGVRHSGSLNDVFLLERQTVDVCIQSPQAMPVVVRL